MVVELIERLMRLLTEGATIEGWPAGTHTECEGREGWKMALGNEVMVGL